MEMPGSLAPVLEVPMPFPTGAAAASSATPSSPSSLSVPSVPPSNHLLLARQDPPPPLQRSERYENGRLSLEEKLSLVALICFGILASTSAFLLGCAGGFVCYEVIDDAARRNHYYAFIRDTCNEADAWLVVSVATSAMWIIKQIGPLLCVSSAAAGIYVGVRLAKYAVAKYASRVAAPL